MVRQNRAMKRHDETGLGTLEWLLIVAAVGGMVTIAILVVNSRADEMGEASTPNPDERTAQHEVDEEMRRWTVDCPTQPCTPPLPKCERTLSGETEWQTDVKWNHCVEEQCKTENSRLRALDQAFSLTYTVDTSPARHRCDASPNN